MKTNFTDATVGRMRLGLLTMSVSMITAPLHHTVPYQSQELIFTCTNNTY